MSTDDKPLTDKERLEFLSEIQSSVMLSAIGAKVQDHLNRKKRAKSYKAPVSSFRKWQKAKKRKRKIAKTSRRKNR